MHWILCWINFGSVYVHVYSGILHSIFMCCYAHPYDLPILIHTFHAHTYHAMSPTHYMYTICYDLHCANANETYTTTSIHSTVQTHSSYLSFTQTAAAAHRGQRFEWTKTTYFSNVTTKGSSNAHCVHKIFLFLSFSLFCNETKIAVESQSWFWREWKKKPT